MQDGEKEHGVCRLSVEPLALVERQELDLWAQEPQDIAAHGQQDQAAVEQQHQSGAARYPHRVRQAVEGGQPCV